MRPRTLELLAIAACLCLAISPVMAWDNIIDCEHSDTDYTKTLRLEGPRWNNTLVRNCEIHDHPGDGIFLKNVHTVRIENCEMYNLGGRGIKLSNVAGGSKVEIINNHIHDIFEDGIIVGQEKGVDWPGTVITDNLVERTARNVSWPGHVHGMYVSSTDSVIKNNRIDDVRDGTGINVRSSSIISGNIVNNTGKGGISYYVDHDSGPSNLLIIENNTTSRHHQNDLLRFNIGAIALLRMRFGFTPVTRVIIRNNRSSITNPRDPTVAIHHDWVQPGFNIQNIKNIRINENGSNKD